MSAKLKEDKEILELGQELKKFKSIAQRVADIESIQGRLEGLADKVVEKYDQGCKKTVKTLSEKLDETSGILEGQFEKAHRDYDETYGRMAECKAEINQILKKAKIERLIDELLQTSKAIRRVGEELSRIEGKNDEIKGILKLAKIESLDEKLDRIRTLLVHVASGVERIEGKNDEIKGILKLAKIESLEEKINKNLESESSKQQEKTAEVIRELIKQQKMTRMTMIVTSIIIVLVVVVLKFLNFT